MATKIRLARHGHKDYAYYHIVVADSRSPRDGKYIERIGSYNPNSNPAKVDLKFDRALYWVNVGAQPTDAKNGESSQAEADKKAAAAKALFAQEVETNKAKAAEVAKKRQEAADALAAAAVEAAQEAAAAEAEVAAE